MFLRISQFATSILNEKSSWQIPLTSTIEFYNKYWRFKNGHESAKIL